MSNKLITRASNFEVYYIQKRLLRSPTDDGVGDGRVAAATRTGANSTAP
jgi:hypothetical protein